MSVRPEYVRLSIKSFLDFSEGRRVMHDGMQYDPIQGQGHEPLKFGNPSIFKCSAIYNRSWQLTTDS